MTSSRAKLLYIGIRSVIANLSLLVRPKQLALDCLDSTENKLKYETVFEDLTISDTAELKHIFTGVHGRIWSQFPERDFVESCVEAHGKFIESCGAGTVFELGAGHGRILIRLAVKFPNLSFIAIEPTLNGCRAIERAAYNARVENVQVLNGYLADELQAVSKADFMYSNLAFEQMGSSEVVDTVLSDLRELPNLQYISLLEPLSDVQGPLTRAYLRAMNYLDLSTSRLSELGFTVLHRKRHTYHHNIRFRLSHTVARKSRT
jgi:hypothetical protein